LNGLPDLVARRVRFIGDAQARIREDYLRSLRYFRFHAWYGDIAAGFDTEALAAISANLDGLQTLSRERVGAELTKLLSAADPAPALAGMRQTGVLAQVLPGADDRVVAPLIHHEGELGIGPDPMRRLSALAPAGSVQTLRLSKAQTRHVVLLRDLVGKSAGAAEMGYRHGADTARDAILLRSALLEQPVMPAELDAIQIGVNAVFPVKPADLMPDLTGAALGQRLDDLTRRWIASNFTLTRAELLNPGQ